MTNRMVLLLILAIYFLELPASNSVPVQNAAYNAGERSLGGEVMSTNSMSYDVNNQLYNAYRKAAVDSGIDPEIVAEVIRTRQPHIKVETEENGGKRTTTVTLQPDGTISKHTRVEHRPTFVFSSLPSFSPSENVSVSQKKTDWEWNPNNFRTFVPEPLSHSDEGSKWTSIFPDSSGPQQPIFGHRPEHDSTSTAEDTHKIEAGNTRTVTNTLVSPTEWRSRTIVHSQGPWSDFDTHTTTTVSPKILNSLYNEKPDSFPSLEDFLKSQYATSTISPKDSIHNITPVTTINVQDLPFVKILSNREALDFAMPTSPQLRTETKTYTRTIQSNGLPDISGLDPDMKSILEKAGINPLDALASPDGIISKTRHEPDGTVVTTKYRIRTVPVEKSTIGAPVPNFQTHFDEKPQGSFFFTQPKTQRDFYSKDERYDLVPFYKASSVSPSFNDFRTTASLPKNSQAVGSVKNTKNENSNTEAKKILHQNSIDEFLGKFNLNASLIETSNGEIVKTIIDDNGRVLTTSFVLSTVRNNDNQIKGKEESAPIK